jgi:hypothetical protein
MNNPVLDEIAGLSPEAQAALAQAHAAMAGGAAGSAPAAPAPLAPLRPPQPAPPALGATPEPAKAPDLGPMAPMAPSGSLPSLEATAGQIPSEMGASLRTATQPDKPSPLEAKTAQDQATQQQLSKGSGISQIHSKIENSDFGQNHPILGKVLGWGAEIPARLADIGASAVAPALAINTPGTEYHHRALVNQAGKQVGADEQNAEREAATGHIQAETEAIPSQIAHTEAETEALKNPKPKEGVTPEETTIHDLMTGENGQPRANPDTGKPYSYLEAYGAVAQAKQDTKPGAVAGPLSADQAKQRNAIWNPVLTKNHLPIDPFKEGMTDKDATEVATQLNNATGKTQAGVKIDMGQGTQGTARADKSYQLQSTRLDKVRQPIEAIQQRVGRLNDTLNQQSPQADALVAPELLSIMSGGAGSGLRMNEAEIARIVGGRSAWESLKANIQHWATDPEKARSITADQDKQIRALVGTVQSKLVAKQKIMDDAEESLLASNDPKEHRQVVADARKSLDAIDAGTAQAGGIEVKDPTGKTHTFSDQKSADAFKKAAGIQ